MSIEDRDNEGGVEEMGKKYHWIDWEVKRRDTINDLDKLVKEAGGELRVGLVQVSYTEGDDFKKRLEQGIAGSGIKDGYLFKNGPDLLVRVNNQIRNVGPMAGLVIGVEQDFYDRVFSENQSKQPTEKFGGIGEASSAFREEIARWEQESLLPKEENRRWKEERGRSGIKIVDKRSLPRCLINKSDEEIEQLFWETGYPVKVKSHKKKIK